MVGYTEVELEDSVISRIGWWRPLEPNDVTIPNGGAQVNPVQVTSLEEWVWQTLDSVAGAASVVSEDEDDEVEVVEEETHLVTMVSSITFSAS